MPSARTGDGIEIAYRTAASGPLGLLLVHGWAGSGAYQPLRGAKPTTVSVS